MDYKEMWIKAWDEIYQAAIDGGISEKSAMALADQSAGEVSRERLADFIDYARLLHKEGRL